MTKSPYKLLQEEHGDDIQVNLRDDLLAKANKLHEDFSGAFFLLQVIQNLTGHSHPICEEQHIEIGNYHSI